jgi:beta-barrel assembly-enhancing protease
MRLVLPGSGMGNRIGYGGRRGPSLGPKLLIALVMAASALFAYFSNTDFNEITQEKQHLSMTADQEITLGLQATPQMAAQYGGESTDPRENRMVDEIGNQIVSKTAARSTPYRFDFHVLADDKTINAFALPGGQVFITRALLNKLTTEGQLAGVLGHEVGHVVARHSAEHLAKQQLTNGLTGAAAIAMYDPENPQSRNSAMIAAMIGSLVNMRYGRQDELESDRLGVRFTAEAGYDPRAMIEVMKILGASSKIRTPEFFSTHPNPENRIGHIQQAIAERFPDGVPNDLVK